jgi:hypothetical protein
MEGILYYCTSTNQDVEASCENMVYLGKSSCHKKHLNAKILFPFVLDSNKF